MQNMPDASPLLRKRQFETSQKERKVALLRRMITDFDKMIAALDEQIAAEEDRSRIKDTSHPAYSIFATAAAKRRQNLLISLSDMKSMLDTELRDLGFGQVGPLGTSNAEAVAGLPSR